MGFIKEAKKAKKAEGKDEYDTQRDPAGSGWGGDGPPKAKIIDRRRNC